MLSEWLAAYVYTSAPARSLLLGPVAPLIDDAQRFFFVRYGEGGPHVRLRFLVSDVERFRARLAGALADLDVRFVPYEPEVERYGDMELAERQFDASSRAVMHWMRESHSSPLAAAIGMHVTFAKALGLDAVRFFANLTRDFVPWHPEFAAKRETLDRIAADYESRFAAQRDALVDPVHALWNGEREPWLDEWFADMRTIGLARHSVLTSWVHMTNNRLGLANGDEPYLAYLLKRSLQCAS